MDERFLQEGDSKAVLYNVGGMADDNNPDGNVQVADNNQGDNAQVGDKNHNLILREYKYVLQLAAQNLPV